MNKTLQQRIVSFFQICYIETGQQLIDSSERDER